MRAREVPSTRSFTLPFGSLRCWTIVATVPIELISSAFGVVDPGVPLGGQEDLLVASQRLLDGQERAAPSDDERHHRVGKDDDVPQGDHRERADGVRTLHAFLHESSPWE
jgi:hypothetical protein